MTAPLRSSVRAAGRTWIQAQLGKPISSIALGTATGSENYDVNITNTSKVFLVFGSASGVAGQNARTLLGLPVHSPLLAPS